MRKSNSTKYYMALFAAVFIWSSAFIVTKIALTGLGPVALSSTRILIAFIILLPFALKRGFHFKDIFRKNSFIYGVSGYGGNLLLLSIGMLTCSASISAIIHGLFPFFMILFGYFMLKESIDKNKIIGILFSVSGVIIASIADLTQNSGTTVLGVLLVVLSVFTWAFYSVFAKKTASTMDSFVLTELCFATAFLFTLPLAIAETLYFGFTMPGIGTLSSLLYLGIISGAAGTILWNFGLKKVDSALAGIYFNLMPVIGLFFAIIIGEKITSFQIAGCLLILIGVFIGTKSKTK